MPRDAPHHADRLPVAILVLNWANPVDTISCIESIRRLLDDSFYLVVVDNASPDDSFELITAYLKSAWNRGRVLVDDRAAGGTTESVRAGDALAIRTTRNLGYAGGNNVGIRTALHAGCEAVWILNNDTVVEPDTLAHLLATMGAIQDAAAIGALIVERDGTSVQCIGGGRYSWWLGRSRLVGRGLPVSAVGTYPEDSRLDYVSGASMLVPASALRRVGLLDERFFLYCEEVDYAERGRRRGLRLTVSRSAIVRHRFGATIGTSRDLRRRSSLSAYHASRSAVLVVRLHRPWLLPLALGARLFWGCVLAVRGPRSLAGATIRGAMHGLLAPAAAR
jgi:GT2 family glycosyltransferase